MNIVAKQGIIFNMIKLCECGCGQEIINKPYHKYYGIPRFIDRHQNRGKNHPLYGKHPSKETSDKKRRSMTGKHHTEETKNKIRNNHSDTSGENNAMYKDGRTLNKTCKACGEPLGNYKATYCMNCYNKSGKNNPNYKNGKPHCEICGKELGTYSSIHCQKCYDRSGEKSPMWQGGKSFEPYPISFNNQLKDKIRTRDNFICQLCGIPELECDRRLTCHHIDYNKKNCKENNLTALCCSCNSKVNTNREQWSKYFKQAILSYAKKTYGV